MLKKDELLKFANLLQFRIIRYTLEKDKDCIHEKALAEGAIEDITLCGKKKGFILSFLFNKKGDLVGYTGESVGTYVSVKELKEENFIKSLL